MVLNKQLFEKHRYRGYKGDNDPLTKAVIEFVKDQANVEQLEGLNNEFGIPPVYSFVALTNDRNKKLFNSTMTIEDIKKRNNNKRYLGKLFGAVFRELGYKPKLISLYVHSASIYLRK